MKSGEAVLKTNKLNFARIFGVLVILLFAGIVLMVVLIVRAAINGPSAPTSTYDYNLNQYQSQLDSNPNDIGARIGMAQTYLSAKQYDEAKVELVEAIKLEGKKGVDAKKLSLAHYLLGQIYNVQNKVDPAISELRKATAFDPTNETAFFYLGTLQTAKRSYKEAANAFKVVIALNPVAADAHYQLGIVYSKLGNKIEALEELRTALKFMPGDRQTLSAIESVSKGK